MFEYGPLSAVYGPAMQTRQQDEDIFDHRHSDVMGSGMVSGC